MWQEIWQQRERCFIELAAIVEARGFDWSLGSLLVAAWRGQAKQTHALIDVVAGEAARQGQGYQLVFADYARCILELGLVHYQEAYESVSADTDDTLQLKFALADLVEAAQRSGDHRAAQRHVDRLAKLAAISRTPRNLGLLARARAIVSGDAAEAEVLYEQAVAQHALLHGPAHVARSHLVYGEWLRRGGRRKDAREHLRAAHALFEEMGARAFSSRARTELQATGETLRPRRSVEADTHLTPQEEHVARLPAVGATNAEIAAQLLPQPLHCGLPPSKGPPQTWRRVPTPSSSVPIRTPLSYSTGSGLRKSWWTSIGLSDYSEVFRCVTRVLLAAPRRRPC